MEEEKCSIHCQANVLAIRVYWSVSTHCKMLGRLRFRNQLYITNYYRYNYFGKKWFVILHFGICDICRFLLRTVSYRIIALGKYFSKSSKGGRLFKRGDFDNIRYTVMAQWWTRQTQNCKTHVRVSLRTPRNYIVKLINKLYKRTENLCRIPSICQSDGTFCSYNADALRSVCSFHSETPKEIL